MKAWFQRADFSTTDYELDLLGSIKLMREQDWAAELNLFEKLEASGQECCPPGAGFVHESGRILHICPDHRSASYHFHMPKKFLGLIPNGTRVIFHEDYNLANIPGLLTSYFNEEWDSVEWAN